MSDDSANRPISFVRAPLISSVSKSTLFVRPEGLAQILQLETKTIPIVVGGAEGDLVEAGLVNSLAKPGGNITGSQLLSEELVSKRLQLLKALIPNLAKVALL